MRSDWTFPAAWHLRCAPPPSNSRGISRKMNRPRKLHFVCVGLLLLSPTVTLAAAQKDRKSTRLNSSHVSISYAVFCLKKKRRKTIQIIELSTPAVHYLP